MIHAIVWQAGKLLRSAAVKLFAGRSNLTAMI